MANFIVIALATSNPPDLEDCQIVPEGTAFQATHKQVFGPDSKQSCEAFVQANGKKQPNGDAIPVAKRVALHVVLALAIVVVVIGSGRYFAYYATDLGKGWVVNLRPGRGANDTSDQPPQARAVVNEGFPPAIALTPTQLSRMQNQLDDIRKRAKHHIDVAIFYYSGSFMAIMTLSLAAALAAFSLAILSRKGLTGTNEYIITMFFVSTALAIFYQSLPAVFQQRKNVDDNRALYVKYVNLEDDMISYIATGSITIVQSQPAINLTPNNSNSGTKDNAKPIEQTSSGPKPVSSDYYIKSLSPEEYILYTDFQLKKYNDVAIGFDESKAASFAKEQFETK